MDCLICGFKCRLSLDDKPMAKNAAFFHALSLLASKSSEGRSLAFFQPIVGKKHQVVNVNKT